MCGCVFGGVCVCVWTNVKSASSPFLQSFSHAKAHYHAAKRQFAPTRDALGLPEHDQRAAISFFSME